MGFWSSFFGHAAANAYNEMKKEEKETQKWNDLFHEMTECESAFNDYLKSVGINDSYCADVEHVNNGSIAPIKYEIENLRKKINEYLSLGGQGKNLFRLADLDDEIETLKYLKKMGCVHRHEEYAGLGIVLVQAQLENDLREERAISSLVNLHGNTLSAVVNKGDNSFIPYDSWEESVNTIKINTAKLYSEDTVQFLEYKSISLVFTKTNIYVYSYDLDEHSHLYSQILIDKNKKLNIASLPIPAVEGWSMVVVDDLQILCDNNEAEKVMELYRKHNADIYLEEELLQQTAAENINQLSGVEFEKVCQQLIESMGFETETTKTSVLYH